MSGSPTVASDPPGEDSPARPPIRRRDLTVHVGVLLLGVVGVIALWRDLATTWRAVMAVTVGVVGADPPPSALQMVRATRDHRRVRRRGDRRRRDPGLRAPGHRRRPGEARRRPPPVAARARLGIGAAIVFAVARVSLEPFWTDHELPHPRLLAASATVALVLVPGLVIALIGQVNGDGRKLAQRPTVSHLDVVVLRADAPPTVDRTTPPRRLADRHLDRPGQGRPDRLGRRPTAGAERGGAAPTVSSSSCRRRRQRRAGALDGAGRPRRAARRRPRSPCSTTRPTGSSQDWRTPLSGPTGRAGDALRLADLPADRTTSEAKLGLLAATQSPTAASDLALAVAHRPILRFDTHEPVPRPLDVEALLPHRPDLDVRGRPDAPAALRAAGRRPRAPERLQPPGVRQPCPGARRCREPRLCPCHAHAAGRRGRRRADLPRLLVVPARQPGPTRAAARSAARASASAASPASTTSPTGRASPSSLSARDPAGRPVAVNYAQHDGRVRYTWPALQRLWELTGARRFAPAGDLDARPLVFSARGTHASYPIACGAASCPPNVVPTLRNTARGAGQPARRPPAVGGRHRRGLRGDLRRPAPHPPRRRRARRLERLAGNVGHRQLRRGHLLRLGAAAEVPRLPRSLPAAGVREQRGRLPRRPVRDRPEPDLPHGARRGRPGRWRPSARPRRLVLLGRGGRRLRARDRQREQQLPPVAQRVADAPGPSARSRGPPLDRVQRRDADGPRVRPRRERSARAARQPARAHRRRRDRRHASRSAATTWASARSSRAASRPTASRGTTVVPATSSTPGSTTSPAVSPPPTAPSRPPRRRRASSSSTTRSCFPAGPPTARRLTASPPRRATTSTGRSSAPTSRSSTPPATPASPASTSRPRSTAAS